MPELPEVETIIRYLKPKLMGRVIASVRVNEPRIFRYFKNYRPFIKGICGPKISALERRGKNIIFRFANGKSFALHLMMTGHLLINPSRIQRKHCRALFNFKGGDKLAFFDVRKFGMIRDVSQLSHFGPDALAISSEKFMELLRKRKTSIKIALLNQAVISGVGNIYADEALWLSGIHPLHKTNSLTDAELEKLRQALKKILKKAIKYEGTSSRDYKKPDGSKGRYFAMRKAYQRAGEKCLKRDNGIIQRIIVGQRSAYYCPKHQK